MTSGKVPPPEPTELAGGQLIFELKTEVEADLQHAVFEAGEWLHKNAADGEGGRSSTSLAERRLAGPAAD
jgi:hypothetical protein